LLHDLGKVAELSYDRAFEYTDEGRLIGHISIGMEMLQERIGQLPGFPGDLAMLLKHMLLSHHGQYEYGSPKRPKTVEATILHYLDDMDSKINGIRTHICKDTAQGSRWTGHHRLYNLYFLAGTDCKSSRMKGRERPQKQQNRNRRKPLRPMSGLATNRLKRFKK